MELHGTLYEVQCLGACGRRIPMTEALDRVRAGEDDPACEACGGVLKSATVSFGQTLVPEVLDAAVAAVAECDLFVAAGTSLTVRPAATLPVLALRAGAPLVVLNAEPTPYDLVAAAVLREPLGTLLPALVSRSFASGEAG